MRAQGIESNLAVLEDAQAENIRQLAQEVVAAVEDSEAQVQVLILTQHISPGQCCWCPPGQMPKSKHSLSKHRLILQKFSQPTHQCTCFSMLPWESHEDLCHHSLQRALQTEARRSAESLQRLPALLAAALPVMDVTALQALPEGGSALSRQRPAGQLALADKAWLQSMLESAMQQAADNVLEAQVPVCFPCYM